MKKYFLVFMLIPILSFGQKDDKEWITLSVSVLGVSSKLTTPEIAGDLGLTINLYAYQSWSFGVGTQLRMALPSTSKVSAFYAQAQYAPFASKKIHPIVQTSLGYAIDNDGLLKSQGVYAAMGLGFKRGIFALTLEYQVNQLNFYNTRTHENIFGVKTSFDLF